MSEQKFVAQRDLVELVPLSPSHVDHIMTWVNDREIVGNLAAFSGKPFTRDDELSYIDKMVASKDDRVFSIFAPSSSSTAERRYLGQCGIHQIFRRSRVGRASLIVADRSDMGRGVGSAALARLLDVAFAPADRGGEDLHKVWLMCFRENERARRTYNRVGFVDEGVLREEYLHEGNWRDMVRMSILSREWTPPL